MTIQRGNMGQCSVATWTSHGLPCGSGKMPNHAQQPKIQKYIHIKYTAKNDSGSVTLAAYSTGPPNIAVPPNLEVRLNLPQNLRHFGSISAKYIQPPNNTPNKMEAHGFDHGTSMVYFSLCSFNTIL
jgi:hypothetical protein